MEEKDAELTRRLSIRLKVWEKVTALRIVQYKEMFFFSGTVQYTVHPELFAPLPRDGTCQ